MYFLTFFLQFDRDQGLDQGRLCLRHLEKGTLNVWLATSATAGKQYPESFHEKGGVIPPEYRVPGLKYWTVVTTPIPMPEVKGVEGDFYQISPHDVTTDKGGCRGDFGIHFDGGVTPGSLGCIVMSKERFTSFEQEIKKVAAEGVSSVPLFVTYS